jgi:hypothetical protein
MRTPLLVVLMLAFASSLVAQSAPVPLPCKVPENGWRLAQPWLIFVNCGFLDLTQFNTTAQVAEIPDKGSPSVIPGFTGRVELWQPRESWLIIHLEQNGKPARLASGKTYEIKIAPDGAAVVSRNNKPAAGPFEPLAVNLSTKPVARVEAPVFAELGIQFELRSNIAYRPFDRHAPRFSQLNVFGKKEDHSSETVAMGITLTPCPPDQTCPDPAFTQDHGPDELGVAVLTLTSDRLRQPQARAVVEDLFNIFGDQLKIEGTVQLGGVPKTKDDADWYWKFSHQAGPGGKPGFVSDIKIAPNLGAFWFGGYTFKPAVLIDIGQGTVSSVKTNNLVSGSLGITRLYVTHQRGLEAARVTPGITFETDRQFDKRNLFYDQEIQFHFSDFEMPRKIRARKILPELKKKDPEKYKNAIYSENLAAYGYGFQFFFGGEFGGSFIDRSVKASASSAQVNLPSNAVARLRPRARLFLEFHRLTLDVSAAGRYLLPAENVTRESRDGKNIHVEQVSGFKPYGEAGLSIGLDSSGHIALSSTFKLGWQPPTFVKVNTIQSGILIRY